MCQSGYTALGQLGPWHCFLGKFLSPEQVKKHSRLRLRVQKLLLWIVWIYPSPSNSQHQDYHMFCSGISMDHDGPSFPTVTQWGVDPMGTALNWKLVTIFFLSGSITSLLYPFYRDFYRDTLSTDLLIINRWNGKQSQCFGALFIKKQPQDVPSSSMSLGWRFVVKNGCGDWHPESGMTLTHISQKSNYDIIFHPHQHFSLTRMLFRNITTARCVKCVESYGRVATWRHLVVPIWLLSFFFGHWHSMSKTPVQYPIHRKECSPVQPTPKNTSHRYDQCVGSLCNTYYSWKWKYIFWN